MHASKLKPRTRAGLYTEDETGKALPEPVPLAIPRQGLFKEPHGRSPNLNLKQQTQAKHTTATATLTAADKIVAEWITQPDTY